MKPWKTSGEVVALRPARGLRRRPSTDRLVAIALVAALLGALVVFAAVNQDGFSAWANAVLARLESLPDRQAPAPGFDGTIGICTSRTMATCVIDGDTIRLRGERIRLADIDAPELSRPDCAAERLLAERARDRLAVLLSQEPWHVARQGTDRYGRTLARLELARGPAGTVLVREGLADWYADRPTWC